MKKLLGFSVLLCLILLCFSTIVNADSFKVILTPDKNKLKPGDEVEVKIKISDINIGESGMNTLEAKLVYDESIFEKVEQEDISSKNNWSLTYNSEETEQKGKMLAMILSTGVKTEQEIGSIKLKVRKDLTSTTKTKQTEIKFNNISTNNGVSIINEENKVIPITLEFENVVEPTTPTQPSTPVPTVQPVTSEDKTVAEGSVPQTGTNEIVVLSVMAVITLIGTITFIRYRNIIIK